MRVLAWILPAVGPAAAFNPAAAAGQLLMGRHHPQGLSNAAVSGLGHFGLSTTMSDSSEPSEELGSLSMALELAVRTENYEEAARLRDELSKCEAANPIQAVRWRQLQQVRDVRAQALLSGEPLDSRLEAVQALTTLAFPPAAAAGAEDALHKILLDVSGEDAEVVREAADSALWTVWMKSGDEEIDDKVIKGMRLMQSKNLEGALATFTEVIEKAPDYAEGWNKRATVHYMMSKYQRSIDDCLQVLKRKPRHFGCLSGLGLCYFEEGDNDEGIKWFKAALDVHPGMMNAILKVHQEPQQKEVVQALKKGAEVKVESSEDVSIDWDLHRVTDDENGRFQYFIRLKYTNKAPKERMLSIVSRFYAVKFADGEVLPFTRVLEEGSQAKFSLAPGEEYKFCWQLVSPKEVKGISGGTLFEILDYSGTSREGFTRCGHEVLYPDKANEVIASDQTQLGAGHFFYGYLDLRAFGNL